MYNFNHPVPPDLFEQLGLTQQYHSLFTGRDQRSIYMSVEIVPVRRAVLNFARIPGDRAADL